MPRPFVAIEPANVGKATFHAFGRAWPVSGFIGRIMAQDVGKRVYLIDGILQVENNEQRQRRVEREATETLRAMGATDIVHLSSAEPAEEPSTLPQPLAIGTPYDNSTIEEVEQCDETDRDMPYLYRLHDGRRVWIPHTPDVTPIVSGIRR